MKTFAIFASALALGAAAMGPAAMAADTSVVKVQYKDLDPARTRDAAVLLRRLDSAAMEACGAAPSSLREYRLSVRASSCYRESLDRAVADLDAPAVTQLYQAHGGETVAAR